MKLTGKKMAATVLLLLLVCSLSVYGSYAYFTSFKAKTNDFTVGKVAISLTEDTWDHSVDHPVTWDGSTVYQKNPTVKNIGDSDAYIRINLQFKTRGVEKAAGGAFTGVDLLPSLQTVNGEKWDCEGSGMNYTYVYKEILSPDNTAVLFESVQLPEYKVPDEWRAVKGGFDIILTAEAIQAYGFSNAQEAFAAYDGANA